MFKQHITGGDPGALVKAARLDSRKSRARPPLWHSDFKEATVSSPLTRKDVVLWEASVTKR